MIEVVLGVAALCLLGAAISDIRSFTISNWFPLALIALFIVHRLIAGFSGGDWWNVAHFGIALAVSMLLFGLKWIGGGDAKLYAAAALWFPLGQGPKLIFLTGIAGLVLAIVYFATRRWAKPSADGKKKRGDRRIPYGVAIALGAIACWFLQAPKAPNKINFNELPAAR
jgi:prepilin peptidase CpaA